MTNKEKYKKAFGTLHTSEGFRVEGLTMKETTKKRFLPRAAVAIIMTCVLAFGTLTVCYAADIGGFRQTVKAWLFGEERDVTIEEAGDGEYNISYVNDDGETESIHTGGVAIEADGMERPLTAEEQLESFEMHGSIKHTDEGRIILCYYDQQVDITDKFEDGICKIELEHNGEKAYFVITENEDGDFALTQSSEGYQIP